MPRSFLVVLSLLVRTLGARLSGEPVGVRRPEILSALELRAPGGGILREWDFAGRPHSIGIEKQR